MSRPVLCPRLCAHGTLGYGVLLLASLPLLTAGRQGNCSHPVVPEHGGFRCEPSPCRGFPQKTSIHFFCEPGYHIPGRTCSSKCLQATWVPPVPTCLPLKERKNDKQEEKVSQPLPSVATTAVGVSIFLLTTTACMVLKSRLYPCHSPSRRSSDQLDLMVEGVPVSLPSYEEAVYGSWGQRLPSRAGPGPTQLLLAREESDDPRPGPNHAPPPYEEAPPRPGIMQSPIKDS